MAIASDSGTQVKDVNVNLTVKSIEKDYAHFLAKMQIGCSCRANKDLCCDHRRHAAKWHHLGRRRTPSENGTLFFCYYSAPFCAADY